MNRFFLCTILIGTVLVSAQAQKLIALQNGSKTFFHQRLDTILTRAADGDTIYLPGYTYNGAVTLNKRLTIFGTGHYPDSTVASGRTTIYGILYLTAASSGSMLQGCDIEGDIMVSMAQTINSIMLSRCKVGTIDMTNAGAGSSAIQINECVVTGYILGSPNLTNFSVENCIVQGFIQAIKNVSLIRHCVLLSPGCGNCSGGYNSNFYDSSGAEVISNIIIGGMVLYPNTCFFKNNLIVGTPNLTAPNTGNIQNQLLATLFESPNTGKEYVFDYTNNYHLNAASPGIGAAQDGTDIGIYGGVYPFKTIPATPHVTIQNNDNQVKNGKLKVAVTVEAQKDNQVSPSKLTSL